MGLIKTNEEMIDAELSHSHLFDRVKEILKKEHMSPRGKLGLPKLLERQRMKLLIPDEAFAVQPVYDRILVMQLADSSEKFAGTSIIKPKTTQRREFEETPRGLIVGAGLGALDAMRSNGLDLGHEIVFITQAPWRWKYLDIQGLPFYLLPLRAGDILCSYDLRKALLEKKCKVDVKETEVDGVTVKQHIFVDEKGNKWTPTEPWSGADY